MQRLEQITSLADLRHMERRLFEQLGVRLTIGTSPNGCAACAASPSWCTSSQACAARRARPSPRPSRKAWRRGRGIVFELLDEGGLFGG